MSKFHAFILIALIGGFAGGAGADTLEMTPAESAARFAADGKPTRGMTQARVKANYGTPESRESPVGDPPISRWDYDAFVVFFEYDKVIHSVSKQ